MLRRIGVTTLIYWCPLYLDYSAQLPIETTGVADQFGSAVHELIYRMLSGDHKGLFDTEEDLAWSVLLESFPGAVESSFTEQVVREMLNMARAAKRFAENYNPSQFEVKFEYGFGSDDMLVIGIADALGENLVLDWKTGSFMAESHRQQVKIYATMLWRLGLLQLPATLGVVYLGKAGAEGSQAESNVFQFSEAEAVVVEDFVQQFLKQYSLGNRRPRISDHCSFCPYGRWCQKTVKDVQTNQALHELWRLQERAGLIQKQLAPGFTEGVHLTEDFVVEKKGSFYLKVRRKNGT